MPAFDPQILKQGQQATARALADRQALAASIAAQSSQISALEKQLAQLSKTGASRNATAPLQTRLDALRTQRTAQQQRYQTIDQTWRDAVGNFIRQLDPCDADPTLPLLLLPVRLETRYSTDGKTLRIRIFPDDIHIDQLDRGLSADEQTAGRVYWNSVWQKPAGDPSLDDAWKALISAVGLARAAWTAAALTPKNLGQAAPATPDFPEVSAPLGHAAIARLLPDRFVAVAFQGQDRSDATGTVIAPELVTGLFADDGGKQVKVNGVPVPPGAEWLVDFNTSLAAGMALNLTLKKPNAAIDQLFVFGVRSSLDPTQTEQQLAALFTSHRCARGLAFLPQGTPSNNTESDRAAWQQRAQPTPPPVATAAAGSNAAVLASALGVDARVFSGLPEAERAEQRTAQAMGSALWPTTWGGFLDKVTTVTKNGSTLSDARREQTRTFFRDNVRARGPLPALRVGQQPYGILPVSALTAARWKTNQGDSFEAGLLPLLTRIRAAWQSCVVNLPRIPGAPDLDKALRDVLGLYPVSQDLRARTVLSNEFALTGSKVGGAVTDGDVLGALIEQLVYEDLNLLSFTHPIGSLAKKPLPLGLPLVDDSDPAVIDAILAGGSPKIASVFQALIALSWEAVKKAVADAAPPDKVRSLTTLATAFPAATQAKVASASLVASTSSSSTLHAIANELSATTGEAGPALLAEHQPAAVYRTSLGALAIDSTNASAKSSLAGFALTAWFRAAAIQAELREALLLLKTTSLDERRILFAETLDLASHRLDAWLTAVIERRRSALRAAHPAGITVGAYGWVENIAPGKGLKPNGGYIHAPGLTHAATAGILRSAYLTHNPDNGGSGAFAIDLSSARARTALDLMDGVRQGQSIGALIGYRIERALHDARPRLDRFALTLRGLAPLVARRLTDRTEAAGTQSQASVAANNVVDGLRLLDLFAKNSTAIRAALTAPPPDNPYIPAANWPAVTQPEWDKFSAIMADAAQAVDAAADMLLAESVHQLVQGNMSGAAASLDAVAAGDAPPPEPDVIRTPAPGVPFSHRLVIAVPVSFSSGAAGWSPARPRAQAEPVLEQWAQSRLGSATDIVVFSAPGKPPVSLAQASLCALDLIYDSGNRLQLEQRIRAAIPTLPADQPLSLDNTVTLGASLRALLVSSQPSKVSDFVRNSEPVTRSFSAAEISAALARAAAAQAQLSAFRDQLALAIKSFDEANPASAVELRKQLEAVASFGLVTPIVEGEHLLSVAQMAADEASERLKQAAAALSGTPDPAHIATAAQALFGDGFWILPAIAPPAAPDLLTAALGATPPCPPPPRAEVRRFIRDNASVRVAPARFSEVLLLADTLGRPIPLRVAQLVEVGAPGSSAWIGGVLDPAQPTPRATIANIIFDAPAAFDPGAPFVGLTIDGWTDVVPIREQRGEAAGSPIDERRVSGIALNAAAASARPPQAMLLAVSPDTQRWTTNALLETLSDTLALAKIRPITLETSPGYGRVLPAIYQASYSLQGEKVFDVSSIVKLNAAVTTLKYVKETS